MRKKVLAMMLLAVLFIVGCSQKMEKDGIMLGKLVNELTGDPISGTVVVDGKEVRTDSEGNFKLETKVGDIAVKKISSSVEGYEDYSSEVIAKDGETIKISLNPKTGQTIEVDGIKVKLRTGIPVQALSLTGEDYIKMLKKEAPKFIQNINGEDIPIVAIDSIAEVAENVEKQYPNLMNLTDEELEKVAEDFPELDINLTEATSDEEIIRIWNTVDEIYKDQKNYVINRQIVNDTDNKIQKMQYSEEEIEIIGGQVGGIEDQIEDFVTVDVLGNKFEMTEAEAKVFYSHLYYAPQLLSAKLTAETLANKVYAEYTGRGTGDNKVDAYRHLMYQYMLSFNVSALSGFGDQSMGIRFAEKMGTARECETWEKYNAFKGQTITTDDRYFRASRRIDLHNNKIARDYFDLNTYWVPLKIEWRTHRVSRWLKIKLPTITPAHPVVKDPLSASVDFINKINGGIFIDKANEQILDEFYKKGINSSGVPYYKDKVIYLIKD